MINCYRLFIIETYDLLQMNCFWLFSSFMFWFPWSSLWQMISLDILNIMLWGYGSYIIIIVVTVSLRGIEQRLDRVEVYLLSTHFWNFSSRSRPAIFTISLSLWVETQLVTCPWWYHEGVNGELGGGSLVPSCILMTSGEQSGGVGYQVA